jgi:hypothetical protein
MSKEELIELMKYHQPLDGGCGGESGESGCQCNANLSEYTWRGWCEHILEVLANGRSA